MPTESLRTIERQAVRIHLTGRIQGLGVRPAVARLARSLELGGSVANSADGLIVHVEGRGDSLSCFLDQLAAALPSGTIVTSRRLEPAALDHRHVFSILDRCEEGSGAAAVPADLVVCEECLSEIRAVGNRRQDYAFNSCTRCGPRYSIITAMPYDRPATSMQPFSLCPACDKEYRTTDDRRFHAQTNSCPDCGPGLWCVDAWGIHRGQGIPALQIAAEALRDGQIIALKGLGGYQLLVDATASDAVQRLRTRKGRRTKPLAVMVRHLAEAERIAYLDDTARRLLVDPAGPIVVVRRSEDRRLAPEIAPDFDTCGVMLPTTPLHALLLDRVGRPLVVTSGNHERRALAYDEATAQQSLGSLTDLWLHHDRPIVRPIDDSVVGSIHGEPCVLRLARGLAPLSLPLNDDQARVPFVALGGEQKSALALCNGAQAVLGPHIGDLSDAEICTRWAEQLQAFMALYGIELSSAVIVHDAHPDYFTTQWAERNAQRRLAVDHHHAHLAAVMLEHGLVEEVLGLAWDGTGYGPDGTIWGGECLRATRRDFQRIAWLRPFPLPGGERAVQQPWRIAVALVREALGMDAVSKLHWANVTSTQIQQVADLPAQSRGMPLTSSMGRLFDGVAALALRVAMAGDDGRPAMLLEQACDRSQSGSYPLPWNRNTGIGDWRPLIAAVVNDLQQGVSPGGVAIRFHRAVADWARELSAAFPELPLVTSGGVFQNAVLGELLAERIAERRANWYRPCRIPPGDGGLAAGQLAVAAARLRTLTKEQ